MKIPLLIALVLSFMLVPCSAQEIADPEPAFEDLPLDLMQRLWKGRTTKYDPLGIEKHQEGLKWAVALENYPVCQIWHLGVDPEDDTDYPYLTYTDVYRIDRDTNKLRYLCNYDKIVFMSSDSGYSQLRADGTIVTDYILRNDIDLIKDETQRAYRFTDTINNERWYSILATESDISETFDTKLVESEFSPIKPDDALINNCKISNNPDLAFGSWGLPGANETVVFLEDDYLVCARGRIGRPNFHLLARLTPDQIESIWALLDQIEYTKWQSSYSNPGVMDGGGYWVRIKRDGKILRSQGDNAGPPLPEAMRDERDHRRPRLAPYVLADHLLKLFIDAEEVAIDHSLSIELPEYDTFRGGF